MEKHDFALESFKNIQELIRFIDQKAGAVLVISGLVLTTFLEFSKELAFTKSISVMGATVFILGLATGSLLTYVIYLSIMTIKPKLAENYTTSEFSLFYFEHLAQMGKDNIHLNFEDLDESVMIKHIIDQSFEVSNILSKKTKKVQSSMDFLLYSIISLLLFVFTSKLI